MIFKYDAKKYAPHPHFKEGSLVACVDAAADIFIA